MPLRVTLEVIPHGNESKKFIAGSLDIENDGTGSPGNNIGIGNYDFTLRGPVSEDGCMYKNQFWQNGRLENFARPRGWWSCVKEVLNAASTDYDEPKDEEVSSEGGEG